MVLVLHLLLVPPGLCDHVLLLSFEDSPGWKLVNEGVRLGHELA